MVVTKGWKARTDHRWAVYRGLRELSIEDDVREYGIGRHRVYCHYPREVVRMPEPMEDTVVIFLDGSGVEGRPPKAGAEAVWVKGGGTRDGERGGQDGLRGAMNALARG